MQLGAESRNKTIAAISLMVLALIFISVRFFPDSPAAAKYFRRFQAVDLPGWRRLIQRQSLWQT